MNSIKLISFTFMILFMRTHSHCHGYTAWLEYSGAVVYVIICTCEFPAKTTGTREPFLVSCSSLIAVFNCSSFIRKHDHPLNTEYCPVEFDCTNPSSHFSVCTSLIPFLTSSSCFLGQWNMMVWHSFIVCPLLCHSLTLYSVFR